MKQTNLNQSLGRVCLSTSRWTVFSGASLLSFLFVLCSGLVFQLLACKNPGKSENIQSNTEQPQGANGAQNSNASTVPSAQSQNRASGFPSQAEFYDLLKSSGNDAFAGLVNEDFLTKYINVTDAYDFVFLVPSEKNQDPVYMKRYLGADATPQDKLAFWLSHLTVASKGIPWEGNPSIYQVALKRTNQVVSYDGGSANITREVRLKDGSQVIFLDKPLKIIDKY